MVRCSKCEKSFKEHTGASWSDGMCNKCWLKAEIDPEYHIPKLIMRKKTNPFDMYLDLYTLREMETFKHT